MGQNAGQKVARDHPMLGLSAFDQCDRASKPGTIALKYLFSECFCVQMGSCHYSTFGSS